MMRIRKSMKRCLSVLMVLSLLLSSVSVIGVSAAEVPSADDGVTLLTPLGVDSATSVSGQVAMSDTSVPYGPIALVDSGKFVFTLLSVDTYSEMTLTFADAVNKRTGAKVTVGTASSTTYEMVIGKYDDLADSVSIYNRLPNWRHDNASDYIIELVGTKLYVVATTEYALQNALDYFLDTFVVDDTGKIAADYKLEYRPHHVQYTLAGNDIKNYVIRTERYPSQLVQRAASAVQKFVMENYGYVLPIYAMNTEGTDAGVYGNEIRIGPMNGAVNMIRPDYTSFTSEDWQKHITIEEDGLIAGDNGYYEMTWDGANVQINGGSVYAISAGVVRLLAALKEKQHLTAEDTLTGNYESRYDYIYGAGYDTVDYSLVDGFGLVYSDEFDYTGSNDKRYETVRSKWTLSQGTDYPTEGAGMGKENASVFPDVYGENWWVAADTAGNNYLFQVAKKHIKDDVTVDGTTYTFYEGVRLASQEKWGFKYGIWETRLVMGTRNGSCSAVWSHTRAPYEADTGYWHEIDVYENYGQDCFVPCLHSFDETMTSGFPHANDEDPENPLLMQGQFDTLIPSMDGTSTGGTNYQSASWEEPAEGEHFWDTFHHVSIDWSYDYLRIYLDGEMVSRIILGEEGPEGADGIYENLFDCYRNGQTIKLSNGAGGRWYCRTRPVGEATSSVSYTPDYWLNLAGIPLDDYFEVQLVDYTRIYQTNNEDIKYEPAKNEMIFDDRFEFNETTKWRYGQFNKAQSFEEYDTLTGEVLSINTNGASVTATEETHLAGFSAAKVVTTGNAVNEAPQMILKNRYDNAVTVQKGGNYDITFYVHVPETQSDYDLRYWLAATNDEISFSESRPRTGLVVNTQTVAVTEKGGWQKIEIAIRDCPLSGELRLGITGTTNEAHCFYIDDVYVEEPVVRAADEAAMNFETDNVGKVLMSNSAGTSTDNNNGSSVVISDTKSYSGTQSALFISDVHSPNERGQMNVTDADGNPVKLEQGEDYWLSFKMYIDKAYYSAADVDANGNILTLKEAPFNFFAACVPDDMLNTYFSSSFKAADYIVYSEEGNLETAKSSPGTAKEAHQARNEWIDVTVKIEDCPVAGNLRIGLAQYSQTQFYCYVDDVRVYEGAQNVTVKFDVNGGTGSYADVTVERGSTIAAVTEPTRDHYQFLGWYTDKDFADGSYFEFDKTEVLGFAGDEITLYARWQGATHDYDHDCDTICNWCGEVREVGDHQYDGDSDADCNICGHIRPVVHDYDDACDAECNDCGYVRVPPHAYDGTCDGDCNLCGAARVIPHAYASEADTACDNCGHIRVSGVSTDVLAGRTVLFSGDSIAYGYGESLAGLPSRAWAQRIADGYSMTVTNSAQNGYALSDVRQDKYLHATLTDGDYDYVVLQGGINDAMDSVAVGTVAATKELADFDTSTFAGGLERYFYYATTKYPAARIGFIITYDVPQSDWGGNTLAAAEYWQVAREICAKWDIAYLDLYSSQYSDAVLQTDTDKYMDDTLHLNSAGYDVITPYIAQWMASIVKYDEIGVHADDGSVDLGSGDGVAFTHTYDNACDPTCNECGEVREITHTYSIDCDTSCDVCGEKRVADADHTFDSACDDTCDVCGAVRDAHVYDNACDADCNLCGHIREVGAHEYTDVCDADCNNCATQRVPPHAYDDICDSTCNLCGELRTAPHNYASDADITCDSCGHTRGSAGASTGVLANQSALFAGDGITGGYGETLEGLAGSAWAQRLADTFGMTVMQQGYAGYSLSDIRQYANEDKRLHTQCFPDDTFDYVILQGGINDIIGAEPGKSAPTVGIGVEIGTVAATKDPVDFDTATFAGGLERYFYHATTKYPDARIGFIITYDVPASNFGGNTASAEEYWQIAREICAKWDVSYLDLGSAHYSDAILKTDTDAYLADGRHLNSAGYDVITPYIAQWMASLVEYSEIGVHADDGSVDLEGGTDFTHTYDNMCDPTCNECGEVRVIDHSYESVCDTTCDICGEVRVAPHVYDDDCDEMCNVCDAVCVAHVYDNACDTGCNSCDHTREVADHVYDNESDAVCNMCGHEREITSADLAFKGASLSLADDLTVNYKVRKELMDRFGYVDFYVVFEFRGERIELHEYTVDEEDGLLVFKFCDVAANRMTDIITSTLYASYDGTEYAGAAKEYSVKQYCYNMLGKCADDRYAELRTLLVDLLHYGTLSQQYNGYKTDDLVNADLTAEQLMWGTSADPVLESVTKTDYATVTAPTVTWKGASLVLNDSVIIRYKLEADSFEGVTYRVTTATKSWTLTEADIVNKNGVYYVYFDGLYADEMSEAVYITAYKNGVAVSNTLRYSIESYACSKQNDTTVEYLAELVKAMMRYGDSAYAYTH